MCIVVMMYANAVMPVKKKKIKHVDHKTFSGFAFVAYVRRLVCRQAMTQNPC